MTVEQIAKKHGVSVESIEAELKMGIEVEKEHVDSIKERRQYSLDHLEEIPDYYTRLLAMEKEAKEEKCEEKDDRKESEGLHDGEVDKAFDKWTSLGEKWDNSPVSIKEDSSKEHFPSISIQLPGKCDFKVGEEIEAEFKVCVESIEKSKDGTRIRLELKEAKFDKED